MEQEVVDLLRCPLSGGALHIKNDRVLASEDGKHHYKMEDGIFHLVAPLDAAETKVLSEQKSKTQTYYDNFGWQQDSGSYGDVQRFTDTRRAPWSYTARCINRIGRLLPRSGRYLLDA